MNNTQHLRYTPTHEWLNIEEHNMTMGITHHAQNLLGDIVFVELPEIGQLVHKGQEMGVLESVKAAADFYAPISGTISEINQALRTHPEFINQDPFGQGWLCKITPHQGSEIADLLNEDHYQQCIQED